jgi:hypothetical protein
VQGDLVAHDCFKAYHVFEMFQEKHNLIGRLEITKKHLGFWYELNMHHDFQDPVATCMELVFLEVLNVTTFSMQSSCSCKYKLPIQFPLKKYLYFCVLLFSCKKTRLCCQTPAFLVVLEISCYVINLTYVG